jgi:hypothetical protein
MVMIKNLINRYKTFIKYIISAGISFAVDLILFTIFSKIFKLAIGSYGIIAGTITARIISSFINYNINRNNVFKNEDDSKKFDSASLTKYIILVIVQMLVSSFSVFTLYNATKINETLIKIPVECILFLVNYFVQKLFIFNKKKFSIPKYLYKYIYLVLSIITSFSLLVELDYKKIIVMSRHNTAFLTYLILGIFLYVFYKKYLLQTKKRTSFKVISIIFTLLLIFGYSFDLTDSAKLVYGKSVFVLISIVKFVGLYAFINLSLNLIYEYIQKLKIPTLKKNKIVETFDKHPFIFSIVVMLICYLPYIIAFYPAIMGYDPANQIKEVLGLHTRYMDSVVLIDPNVTITNFNPVIHTLLLGNLFKLGTNLGNVNFGLFLYSIIQISIVILTLAYSIKFLKREKVPNAILFIILAIYSLVPIYPFYSLSTNKDTFFSMLILLYILKLYDLIKYKYDFKNVILMILICIFLFLFRNNGIYTIFLSLPIFFIVLKEKRKEIFVTLLVVLSAYLGYNKIVLPYFHITGTSIREVLSIPFQQTAALIQKDENIITDEDKQIISNILDYDTIKEKYNPELADKVKNTFNPNYTDEDLKSYFNVWFKYLFKRPLIYIDATINNMYGYFYPNTSAWYLYYTYNTKLKEAGYDYHYNSLEFFRNILSGYGEAFQRIPILSLFVNIGFTVWVYIYLIGYLITSKNKKFILLLLPALSLILVCVASPANTYFRYAMPYIMSLPLILALLYVNRNLENEDI